MNNKNNSTIKNREEIAKTSICADCKGEFEITVGEVAWYKEKCYPEPKRCCICRAKRKQEKDNERNRSDFGY